MRTASAKISSDAVVVGAGPVGLATAVALTQHGLDVIVIDGSSGPTPYSKAIGIHSRTMELMHTVGLSDAMLRDGNPMRDFAVYEAGRPTMTSSFAAVPSPYPFVLGLPQSQTERHLLSKLLEGGGKVLWNHRLSGILDPGEPDDPTWRALVSVQTDDGQVLEIGADWIIGADGGRSTVRDACGIAFPGGSYGNAFILGDVMHDWAGDRHKLQFHLSRSGYLLLIPMPGGMHRVIAQTDRKWEDFQNSSRPDARLEDLQAIIDARGPGGIRAHSPSWLTTAPFYYRLAERAQHKRMFLAGDALHLFSPLGAQGLNTGFGDAFNLAWKVGMVHRGMASTDLLETYGQERLAIGAKLIEVTSTTNRYITAKRFYERLPRALITRVINSGIRIQRDLPALMSGVRQAYDASTPLTRPEPMAPLRAGERLPSAALTSKAGQSIELTDIVHGTGFTLMFIARRGHADVLRALNEVLRPEHVDARVSRTLFVCREAGDDPDLPCPVEFFHDPLGQITGTLEGMQEATVIVRPDGFISTCCPGIDPALVSRFFEATIWARQGLAIVPQLKGQRHVA